MGREAMIRADMEAAGVYSPIYDASIRQLAKTERELSRAEKAWRAAGGQMVAQLVNKTGGAYTAKDPHYAVVEGLRKEIMTMRNQLGLTPVGLKRAQARAETAAGTGQSRIEQLLDAAHDYAVDHAQEWADEVDAYVEGVLSGETPATVEIRQGCERYLRDLQDARWEFRADPANEIIAIMETTICHQQGEALDATPLRGTPFYLLPYHKFVIYNLMGFYLAGTKERRFKEALMFIPRKNIKTTFAAGLAWALALHERASGSKVYEVGGALKQALEGFDFLRYNLRRNRLTVDEDPENGLRIINNNMERSITGDVGDGFVSINALAGDSKRHDSFNCNIVIADEMHTYKSPSQYQVLQDATKAYTNKLVIGISSGGNLSNGFCAKRVEYCRRVLDGTITGDAAESVFIFLAAAPMNSDGSVDYLDPEVLAACNPGWGHSIRPQDMINSAQQARDDPQLRTEFLQKSLNVFTAALRAWFDVEEFRRSDRKYDWSPAQLARLPIRWYGGSDLSKLHDLTAACLFGHYQGVDIILPHCWFPVTAAVSKAEEDHIPLFGWKDDGWLDMPNQPVLDHGDVVRWYKARRDEGFKLKVIGHDRKFCREYYLGMKKAHMPIRDQPQLFTKKSEGFRYLEASAKRGTLYYCHAEPFEYCVGNVRAWEKADDMVMYEKMDEHSRIDVFDCAVFAACAYLEDLENAEAVSKWTS